MSKGEAQSDYKNKPSYIPTYAVEFASLTGMRVSEISALTWDCITDNISLLTNQRSIVGKQKNIL